jgi:uncharacterized membrane protein YGL010W
MPNLAVLLADYGVYHRDPRNRRTHYIGVPAIAYAVLVPAALVKFSLFGFPVALDRVIVAAFVLCYLVLDLRLGIMLTVMLSLLAWAAEATGRLGMSGSLVVAGVVFVLGWVLQFFGHYLEGNRPALLTNLFQIVVAPIYLTAELSFSMGLRTGLRIDVEKRLASRIAQHHSNH